MPLLRRFKGLKDTWGKTVKIVALAAVPIMASVAIAANSQTAPQHGAVPERLAACQGCHGVDGIATLGAAPNLAGQKASYLETQLRAFRAKERKNDLMNAIAGQLSDDEIQALAAYWATLPAGGTMSDAELRAGAVKTSVTFPADFPKGFTLYRTEENPAGQTIVRDWANAPALEAARGGKSLPESGVIVAETLAAHAVDGKLIGDAPTGYAVFAAGPNWGAQVPELLRNGNWHFGIFGADHAPKLSNQAVCLACHKPQADTSFVFTYDALAEKARHPQ